MPRNVAAKPARPKPSPQSGTFRTSKKTSKKAARKPARRAAGNTAAELTLGGIGDAAVRKATGRGWAEWLETLDAEGAPDLDHKQIAELLHDKLGVPPWWSQMVTVGYEQGRGRREKHQTTSGYQVSASRTIRTTVQAAFDAWADADQRTAWLPEAITIRKATARKSLRITWADGKTSVEVNLWDKGPGKCQVVAQHSKIASRAAADRLKAMWGERLASLQHVLEA